MHTVPVVSIKGIAKVPSALHIRHEHHGIIFRNLKLLHIFDHRDLNPFCLYRRLRQSRRRGHHEAQGQQQRPYIPVTHPVCSSCCAKVFVLLSIICDESCFFKQTIVQIHYEF